MFYYVDWMTMTTQFTWCPVDIAETSTIYPMESVAGNQFVETNPQGGRNVTKQTVWNQISNDVASYFRRTFNENITWLPTLIVEETLYILYIYVF